MKFAFTITLIVSVIWATSCTRSPEFHYGFPSIQPKIQVLDDLNNPATRGHVKVITNYWYPTLLGGRKGRSFNDDFPIGPSGIANLILRRHPQIIKQEILVEMDQRQVFRTQVDEDMDWAAFEGKPRLIRIAASSESKGRQIFWRGINVYEPKEYRIPITDHPIQYSLTKGEFVDSGGDISFLVDRPDTHDPDKVNKPVKLTIRPITGLMQKMTQHEVIFTLEGAVAKWGDTESISLEANNSRNSPAVKCALAYSSSDGMKRALLTLHANLVSEKDEEDPAMTFSIWAKVTTHENEN